MDPSIAYFDGGRSRGQISLVAMPGARLVRITRIKLYMKAVLIGFALTVVVLFAGCASSDPILKPSFAKLPMVSPDSFDVAMETSAGTIDFRFYREWSPLGVDRAFYLFKNNFYSGTRFYRVIEGFVAQFGGSGDPKVDSLWRSLTINDEPVVARNKKGTISFARAGARTRSMTMYVNLEDNLRLDSLDSGQVIGYPPIGRVIKGWEVVEKLYAGYAAAPMRTDLSSAVLSKDFPLLDSIRTTTVTRMW